MSISKIFQHFHQEDLGRKVDEIIDETNKLQTNTKDMKTIPIVTSDDYTNMSLGNIIQKYGGVMAYGSNIYSIGLINPGTCYVIATCPTASSNDRKLLCGSLDKSYTLSSADNIISPYILMRAIYSYVSAIVSTLGGTPFRLVENSALHIKGTFTPTASIAAGTKLFGTGQTLMARMTSASAINSGAAGAETFVGISIQTNGDVYCLGALTAGVTYSISVTVTI